MSVNLRKKQKTLENNVELRNYLDSKYTEISLNELLNHYKTNLNQFSYKIKKVSAKNLKENRYRCFNLNCREELPFSSSFYTINIVNKEEIDAIILCHSCGSNHSKTEDKETVFNNNTEKKCANKKCLGIFRISDIRSRFFKKIKENGEFNYVCNFCNFLGIDNDNELEPVRIVPCLNFENCDQKFDLIDDSRNNIQYFNLHKSNPFSDGTIENDLDGNHLKFLCNSCYKYSLKNFEVINNKKVYKQRPEMVELICKLNLSQNCETKKTIYPRYSEMRKNKDICAPCNVALYDLERRKKLIQKNLEKNLICENNDCKKSNSLYYFEKHENEFYCIDCVEKNEIIEKLNADKLDKKIRFCLCNFNYAKSNEELETNYKIIQKLFLNENFSDAFTYCYINYNSKIVTFEDFKKAFSYSGKSQDNYKNKRNQKYLRHLDFSNGLYGCPFKKKILKEILNFKNYKGKIAIFKPFKNLSSNNAFFHEQSIIDYTFDNKDYFPFLANMQPGKQVIIFKNEKIKEQNQEFIFKKTFELFKDAESKNEIEIFDWPKINELFKAKK